jgi:cellulose synthase/poly-beta-1,6-N-acetylglucosamine synthase-like glycosyltransferase
MNIFFVFISYFELSKNKNNITREFLRNSLDSSFFEPITLIVPAYNEEDTIIQSLKSQLRLDYPEYEVVVVNDGSKDQMMTVLIKEFNLIKVNKPINIKVKHAKVKDVYFSLNYPNLIVVDKENGGKADAINCGINISKYPLFCVIDADSLIEKDALLRIGNSFQKDKSIIAVGGTIRAVNGCEVKDGTVIQLNVPKNITELFQTIEYMRAFLVGRTAFSFFNSTLIISGAFGVFKKSIVLKINGMRHTVGEDMDLVVRLHKYMIEQKIPYKILSEPDAICWTQVPSDLVSLGKQRNRWQRGLFDVLFYNKEMILNPKYKRIGLFAMPYFLIIEGFGVIIETLGYLYIGYVLFFEKNSTSFILTVWALIIVTAIFVSLVSIFFDSLLYKKHESLKDITKLIIISFLESIIYRPYISYHRIIGSFSFKKKGWGKIQRQKLN